MSKKKTQDPLEFLYRASLHDALVKISREKPSFNQVVEKIKHIQRAININDDDPDEIHISGDACMLPGVVLDRVIYVLDIMEDKILTIPWAEYLKHNAPARKSHKSNNMFSYKEYWMYMSRKKWNIPKVGGFVLKLSTTIPIETLNDVVNLKFDSSKKYTNIYMICALIISKWYDGKIIQNDEDMWFYDNLPKATEVHRSTRSKTAMLNKYDQVPYICFEVVTSDTSELSEKQKYAKMYKTILDGVQHVAQFDTYIYAVDDVFNVTSPDVDSRNWKGYYQRASTPKGTSATKYTILDTPYAECIMVLKCTSHLDGSEMIRVGYSSLTADMVKNYNIEIMRIYEPLSYDKKIIKEMYECDAINRDFISESLYYPGAQLIVLREGLVPDGKNVAKALAETKILGFAIIHIKKYDDDDRVFNKVAKLKVLCSREQKLTLGVGTKLMNKIEDIAHDNRCDSIEMDSLVSAVSFYERTGYAFTTPIEENWYTSMYNIWGANPSIRAKHNNDLGVYFDANPQLAADLYTYRASTSLTQLLLLNTGTQSAEALNQLRADYEYTKTYTEVLFHMRKSLLVSSSLKRLRAGG